MRPPRCPLGVSNHDERWECGIGSEISEGGGPGASGWGVGRRDRAFGFPPARLAPATAPAVMKLARAPLYWPAGVNI